MDMATKICIANQSDPQGYRVYSSLGNFGYIILDHASGEICFAPISGCGCKMTAEEMSVIASAMREGRFTFTGKGNNGNEGQSQVAVETNRRAMAFAGHG